MESIQQNNKSQPMPQIIHNPEQFRERIRATIGDKYFAEVEEENRKKISGNIEIGVYNWAIRESTNKKVIKFWNNPYFVDIYLNHLKNIYINLRKNPRIIRSIIDGELVPQELALMTHQEMCPEKWAEMIRLKSIKDQAKFKNTAEASTTAFTCQKCRSKKCSYYLQQVRSADEPMTMFISCLDCSHKWRR